MPGLGTSFGRGGATTAQQSLHDADAIMIMGSSMAEQHPVGFQWVVAARERGAKVIHVDPRFTRTSAMSDMWVPLRAGSDILFLGAIINYVLQNDRYFHDYVVHYTNAPTIIREEFKDTEDLGGVFSGLKVNENLEKECPFQALAPRKYYRTGRLLSSKPRHTIRHRGSNREVELAPELWPGRQR